MGFSMADKERLGSMQKVQTSKVGEAAIHDVKAAGLRNQHLENINLVHLAVVDMEEGGNIVAQVEQRMHPAGNLG